MNPQFSVLALEEQNRDPEQLRMGHIARDSCSENSAWSLASWGDTGPPSRACPKAVASSLEKDDPEWSRSTFVHHIWPWSGDALRRLWPAPEKAAKAVPAGSPRAGLGPSSSLTGHSAFQGLLHLVRTTAGRGHGHPQRGQWQRSWGRWTGAQRSCAWGGPVWSAAHLPRPELEKLRARPLRKEATQPQLPALPGNGVTAHVSFPRTPWGAESSQGSWKSFLCCWSPCLWAGVQSHGWIWGR